MNIFYASDYPEEDRYQERSLLKCLPGIFDGYGKRLLYVGASSGRSYLLPDFCAGGYQVDILEAWTHNAKILRQKWEGKGPGHGRVVQGDVRDRRLYSGRGFLSPDSYDVAFWWHGPEHIPEKELALTLRLLERAARLVVLGCPWGPCPQGAVGGNRFERHLSSFEPKDFGALGYSTDVVPGEGPGGRGHRSHITAWKERKANERTHGDADERRRARRASRASRRS